MDVGEQVLTSQPWGSLLPGALRRHVWLVVAHVSLTLMQPDGQSRSFQTRRCAALGIDAYNLVLVQEAAGGYGAAAVTV